MRLALPPNTRKSSYLYQWIPVCAVCRVPGDRFVDCGQRRARWQPARLGCVQRLIVWTGTDAERWEVAQLELSDQGVQAAGTQVAVDPEPYRLDYRLDARTGFVTRSLDLRVTAERWSRRLLLRHDGAGQWSWTVEEQGSSRLPPPGDAPELAGELAVAADCDLGLSPLTNLLPVRRHGLHVRRTSVDLVVAWVSVPDLVLRPYLQRYEHVGSDDRGSTVRFVDLGGEGGFADLQLDVDGVVDVYPGLARRAAKAAASEA
jgi:hypothetical protein